MNTTHSKSGWANPTSRYHRHYQRAWNRRLWLFILTYSFLTAVFQIEWKLIEWKLIDVVFLMFVILCGFVALVFLIYITSALFDAVCWLYNSGIRVLHYLNGE